MRILWRKPSRKYQITWQDFVRSLNILSPNCPRAFGNRHTIYTISTTRNEYQRLYRIRAMLRVGFVVAGISQKRHRILYMVSSRPCQDADSRWCSYRRGAMDFVDGCGFHCGGEEVISWRDKQLRK